MAFTLIISCGITHLVDDNGKFLIAIWLLHVIIQWINQCRLSQSYRYSSGKI